jgi:uncharacterized ferritin-like protein (DUF455 family)
MCAVQLVQHVQHAMLQYSLYGHVKLVPPSWIDQLADPHHAFAVLAAAAAAPAAAVITAATTFIPPALPPSHNLLPHHSLVHIELAAVDLSWDIIVRFGSDPGYCLPKEFFDDFVQVWLLSLHVGGIVQSERPELTAWAIQQALGILSCLHAGTAAV